MNLGILLRPVFGIESAWLAQLPDSSEIETPEAASVLFSGPQFFIALI